MPRYCAETTIDFSKVIIHTQQCSLFDLASLLAEGRVSDIGNHASERAVQQSFQSTRPVTEFCRHCCTPASQTQLAVASAGIAILGKPLLARGVGRRNFFHGLSEPA